MLLLKASNRVNLLVFSLIKTASETQLIPTRKPITNAVLMLIGAASALPAWAQSTATACTIALDYIPVVVPVPPSATAVPGLGMLGVGALAALIAVMAWRKGRAGGHKALSVALMAGAALLATQGSDSLIQAVRAAAPYEFNSATGGTVADANIAFASPSPQITVTNTTTARIKITTNANSDAADGCAVGTEVAPGGSCTTQAVCPALKALTLATPPVVECRNTYPDDMIQEGFLDPPMNYYQVFKPVMTSDAVFTPSITPSATSDFSYSPNFTPGPGGTVLTTFEELDVAGTGTTTIKITPPDGYGFDNNGVVSSAPMVLTAPYQGCSAGTPN